MKINSIITTNAFRADKSKRSINQSTLNSPICTTKPEENTKPKKIILGTLGAFAVAYGSYVAIMVAKKPPKMSFDELLTKKGLEFRNEILVNKSTGGKFTGEIKRNTGKFDKFKHREMIETQKFNEGIIAEKTYTDWRGKEIEGVFYLDGKIRLKVFGIVQNGKMRFGFHDYDIKGNSYSLGDGLMDKKKSIFKWAREYIKSHGWK